MSQSLSSDSPGPPWLRRAADRIQPSEASARIITWGLVALSMALALWHYFGDRSLWLDEAMLAFNVVELPWSELLGKLFYEQIAAVGWLFAQKALYILIGDLEQGLRFLSLATWAATLVIFRNLAVRTFSPTGAVLGVALFSLTIQFLQYAVEAKPYGIDLFIGVAGLALFVDIHASDRVRPATWIGFALLGVFAILFSLGGVLGLAAFGSLSILSLLLRRRFGAALALCAMALAWAVAFLALYLLIYRAQVAGGDLVTGASAQFFERASYAPLPPRSLAEVAWYANWADRYFLFGFKTARVLGVLLLLVGLGVLAARDRLLALVWITPIALGLVVSGLRLYPMFERLTLYSMPALIWTLAAGLDWMSKPDGRRFVAAVCLTLATLSPSLIDIAGYSRLNPPYARHEIRPALKILKRSAAPGDKIYVTNITIPAYLTYRDETGVRALPWRAGKTREENWPCVLQEIPDLRSGDTVWVVSAFDNDRPPSLLPEQLQLAAAIRGLRGVMTTPYQANGAAVHRATFTAGGAAGSPPNLDCGRSVLINRFDISPELARRLNAP